MHMADPLLDDFPPVSKQEWLDKLQSDLKGKPYERLVRTNASGIAIAPVYTSDDLPADSASSYPGLGDMRRGERPLMHADRSWTLGLDFTMPDLADLQQFLEGAGQDVDAVRLVLAASLREALRPSAIAKAHGGLQLAAWADLEAAIQWANAHDKEIWIEAGDAAIDFWESGLLGKPQNPTQLQRGGLDLDPFRYARKGVLDRDLANEIMALAAIALADVPADGRFRAFTLSLQRLEMEGASAAQQIAYACAMATELADLWTARGFAAEKAFAALSFDFPITTDFFGEIGKLRAFRICWANVLQAWGLDAQDPRFTHIQARPAASTDTIADAHVNLLRHTTESMAAVFGGCRMVSLAAYNAHFADADPDGLRIARNIQLVLREEADLGKVIDPTGGAYFVEQLTEELAKWAWGIFQEIEAAGGWIAYKQQGKLQAAMAEGQQKLLGSVRTGARSILGTNVFPNEKEPLPRPQATESAANKSSQIYIDTKKIGAVLGIKNPPDQAERLAAEFESIRARMQHGLAEHPTRAIALLLTLGDPVMRAARATFCRNVLAAGGFVCAENQHPTSIEDAVHAAQELAPSVVVLCGGDADYFAQGPVWLPAIRAVLPEATLLLAGRPEGWEQLKAHGIGDAIYAGMDRVAFLTRLLDTVTLIQEGLV
jgi:methylmalonyl-CoA mutase